MLETRVKVLPLVHLVNLVVVVVVNVRVHTEQALVDELDSLAEIWREGLVAVY